MRARQTPAENLFWHFVRRRQINGYKIRRQHTVGRYIVDFYCPQFRLVIEIDGDIHKNPATKVLDEVRTDYFLSQGYQVIRFTNDQILNSLPRAIAALKNRLRQLALTVT